MGKALRLDLMGYMGLLAALLFGFIYTMFDKNFYLGLVFLIVGILLSITIYRKRKKQKTN